MEKNVTFWTFFYLTSLVLVRMCGILAKIFTARSITPYEYGLITLFVIVLPGAMQLFTNFCFFDILGHAVEGKKYLGFSLIFGIIATAFLASIFFIFRETIFTFLNIPTDYWGILYIILFIVLFAVTLRAVITGYLRGMRNHAYASIFSSSASILRVFFIGFAVYLFGIDNFSALIILFALPPLITLIPVILLKFRELILSLNSINLPNRKIVLFGLSFFILNLWIDLIQQINSIVISHDLGILWQGYYDVSLSTVAVITFFYSAFYLVSSPETTIKNSTSEMANRRHEFGDIGRILLSMCLLCVLIIFFYSHQLVTLLFTEEYAIAGDYLIFLAIGYTILFIQQYCSYLNISTEGEQGLSRLSLITLASLVIFPFFTHFMILYFNFLGVYLATTIFILCYTLVTIILIKDWASMKLLLLKFDRLALSFFGTFLIMYWLHLSLFAGILTSLALFTLLIFSLGYLDKNIIWNIIRVKSEKI